MIRSVLAVAGGLLMAAFVVGVGTIVALNATGGFGPQPNAPYLAIDLLAIAVGGAVGGFAAAEFAPRERFRHAAALAVLVAAVAVLNRLHPFAGEPGWLPWAALALGVAGVLAGAAARVRWGEA